MMINMVGCNHRTAPMTIRERFAFSPEQVSRLLKHWAIQHPEWEAVLLSTCNRTEWYVASEKDDLEGNSEQKTVSRETMLRFLCDEKNIPLEHVQGSFVFLSGHDTVAHLFAVAGSLDSMLVGESQVLAQVKSAYQLADETGTTGVVTHAVFQAALKTAKRIIGETQIHQRRVSIPSVAVTDFALQIFERLDDKKTLVLGAGEMADETLRYLTDYGAKSILVINRNRQRAEELAGKWHGQTDIWENRFDRLAEVDVVISATGAMEPVIGLSEFLTIEPKRTGRSLFILDLAVPRDFDPAIGKCDHVFLYGIDDLKDACERNLASRNKELPKAEKIVKQECERFWHDMQHRKTGSVIQQLQADWKSHKEMELKRLFNKLPNLTGTEREEVRYAFDRLINKLLHPPLESLRDESKHGVPGLLLDAISHLFRLKD
ncbi:MAG: glutamyl-tRNA reductase [Planctomycetaceae bacterium]|nr:glutamyl-tRNA reductase [Planctomycetaceae bacterium]